MEYIKSLASKQQALAAGTVLTLCRRHHHYHNASSLSSVRCDSAIVKPQQQNSNLCMKIAYECRMFCLPTSIRLTVINSDISYCWAVLHFCTRSQTISKICASARCRCQLQKWETDRDDDKKEREQKSERERNGKERIVIERVYV